MEQYTVSQSVLLVTDTHLVDCNGQMTYGNIRVAEYEEREGRFLEYSISCTEM